MLTMRYVDVVLSHSWVNLDHMLQECMVGVLVRG